MNIYNLLFYSTYLLAKRSKNYQGMEVFGGIIFVVICLVFNFYSLIFLYEFVSNDSFFDKIHGFYRFLPTLLIAILVFLYYHYNDRYKKKLNKYEFKQISTTKCILIVVVYYVISFLLMLLSGMLRNGDLIN